MVDNRYLKTTIKWGGIISFFFLTFTAFGQGLNYVIPAPSSTPNVCPADYTKVTAASVGNISGKICVDGGTITNGLSGNGELFITSDTEFKGNLQNISGATFYNYSSIFELSGSSPNGTVTLYNYGKVVEKGINNINQRFTIYNNVNDTVIFQNMSTLSNITLNNDGYVITKKKISANNSTIINNRGYVEMELGSGDINGQFRNSGRITAGSGGFKLQNPSVFENGCGILIEGNLNTQADLENNGVLIYTGNWNAQGNKIINTSEGRVSGGSLTGSTGSLLGSGEFYFTGSFENGLSIGDNNSDFIINNKRGKTLNGSVTENTSLVAATVADFPEGCSPIVTETPVNAAPLATNDTFDFIEDDGVQAGNVSTNDTDDAGIANSTFTIKTAPSASLIKSFNLASDGSFTVEPADHYYGDITFVYEVCDAGATSLCDEATASMTFAPVNDAPIIKDDIVSVTEDQTSKLIQPTSNDKDSLDREAYPSFDQAKGLDLNTLSIVTTSKNGTLDLASISSGDIFYTPNDNFIGLDSIEYRICDDGVDTDPVSSLCGTAWIRITVVGDPTNDLPIAMDDLVSGLAEDSHLPTYSSITSVLANDDDDDIPLGDVIVVTTTTAATTKGGSVTFSPDGSFEYTLPIDFHGVDSIEYTISDNDLHTTTAWLIFEIDPVNDPITAIDDNTIIDEDQSLINYDILANDLNNNEKKDEGYTNGSFIKYPVNQQGGIKSVTIKTNADAATEGTALINPDFTLNFTPVKNFNGTVTITYIVCDEGYPTSECSEADVEITVRAINDKPIAERDEYSLQEDNLPSGGDYVVNAATGLLANDVDDDNDPLTVTVLPNTLSIGTFTIATDGSFTYTPFDHYFGLDSIGYILSDGTTADTAYVVLNLSPLNDEIVVGDDFATTDEETAIEISLYDNDNDINDIKYGANNVFDLPAGELGGIDFNSLTITANPTNGILTGIDKATGKVTYTPNLNFSGEDTFEYELCDIGYPTPVTCNTATVTITVNDLNDKPIALSDETTTCEDTPVTISVKDNDNDDADGNSVADYTIVLLNDVTKFGSAAVTGNDIVYTPNEDENGIDTIEYRICDNETPSLCSDYTFVKINVEAINDSPIVSEVNVATAENTPATFSIRNDVNDIKDYPVGTSLDSQIDFSTFQLITTPNSTTEGTITAINNDGTLDFSPALNVNKITVTLEYEVCDFGVGDNTCGGTASPICERNFINIDISADVPQLVNDTATGTVGDTLWEDESIIVGVLANDSDPNDNGVNNLGDIIISTLQVKGVDGSLGNTDVNIGNALVTVNTSTGALKITPTADYYTGDAPNIEFEYSVTDDAGFKGAAFVILKVWAKNDTLEANLDLINTPEGTEIVIDVLTNDHDNKDNLSPSGGVDATSLSIAPTHPEYDFLGQAQNGTVIIEDGKLKYTPNQNFFGNDSFYYAVADLGYGEENHAAITYDTALVVVTVTNINNPPVTTSDTLQLIEDVSGVINIAINDNDSLDYITETVNPTFGIDTTSIVFFETGSNKIATAFADSVIIDSKGNVTYYPKPNVNKSQNNLFDVIAYTITDLDGAISQDTLYVLIEPVGDTPNIIDNIVTTNEDSTTTLTPLDNDNDLVDELLHPDFAGIDTTTLEIIGGPLYGTVKIDSINGEKSGTLTYIPNENYFGQDTITYKVCDIGFPEIQCDSALIIITLDNVNDKPVLPDSPIAIKIYEDTQSDSLDILSFVKDTIDGDSAGIDISSFIISKPPSFGTIEVVENKFVYTPNANYYSADTTIASDTAYYTIKDIDGEEVTGEILLTVYPINDTLQASYIDAANNIVDKVEGVEDKTKAINWTTKLNDNIDTQYSLGGLDITSITPVNGTTTNGSFTVLNDTIFYTPNLNFDGLDTLNFTACDLKNAGPNVIASTDSTTCIDAAIVIEINGENDKPEAVNDTIGGLWEDSVAYIFPLVNDSDPFDLGSKVSLSNNPDDITPTSGATAVVQGDSLYYLPAPNYFGLDSIQYVIVDDGGEKDTAWIFIDVLPVNDAPIAIDDFIKVVEGDNIIDLFFLNDGTNATDNDLIDKELGGIDRSSFELITPISFLSNGVLADTLGVTIPVIDTTNGSFSYSTHPFNSSTLYFEYKVCDTDPIPLCDTARVTLEFENINNPPIGNNLDNCSMVFTEDTTLVDFPLYEHIIDDGRDFDGTDPKLLFGSQFTGRNIEGVTDAGFNLSSFGNLFLDLEDNYNGKIEFTFEVIDGDETGVIDVCFLIKPINDAPFAMNDTLEVKEDSLLTFNVLVNDFDIDTTTYQYDTIHYSTISLLGATETENGLFELDESTGIITYIPNENVSMITDSIQYTITDTLNLDKSINWSWDYTILNDTAWIYVNIIDVNDNPIITDVNETPIDTSGGGYVDEGEVPGIPGGTPIDTVYLTTEQLTELLIEVRAFDPEGNDLDANLIIPPAFGTTDGLPYTLINDEIGFTYTPEMDETGRYPYVGNDSLLVSFSDGNGGIALLYIIINVSATDLIIYDGFSPNSDGINDIWHIEHIEEYPDNKVEIFNRWGNSVWNSSTYDNSNNVFIGTNNNGNELTAGTYFYVIEVEELGKTYSGYVIINR